MVGFFYQMRIKIAFPVHSLQMFTDVEDLTVCVLILPSFFVYYVNLLMDLVWYPFKLSSCQFNISLRNNRHGSGRMVRGVKRLAIKPEDLCLTPIPRTHLQVGIKNRTKSTELSSALQICTMAHTWTHMQKDTLNK